MRRIYLAQHGLAFDKELYLERPLTPDGIFDTQEVANAVRDKITLTSIYHSGKLRSEQTANIYREIIQSDVAMNQLSGMGPNDNPRFLLELINLTQENALFVGHLPHLKQLASLMLCGDLNQKIINFHNSGILALVFTKDGWLVDWYISPDILSAIKSETKEDKTNNESSSK